MEVKLRPQPPRVPPLNIGKKESSLPPPIPPADARRREERRALEEVVSAKSYPLDIQSLPESERERGEERRVPLSERAGRGDSEYLQVDNNEEIEFLAYKYFTIDN